MIENNNNTVLKSVIAYNPTLVYEERADGTRILRRIRVNSRPYEMPDDGVAVEVAPDTIGTEQIKNEAVQIDNLSDDVKAGLRELDDNTRYATNTDVYNMFAEQTQE